MCIYVTVNGKKGIRVPGMKIEILQMVHVLCETHSLGPLLGSISISFMIK